MKFIPNHVSFFGYKNHLKEDAGSKIIVRYMVTDASVHGSQATEGLLEDKNKGEDFYADSVYSGEPQEKIMVSEHSRTIAGKEMNMNVIIIQISLMSNPA